MRIKKSPKKIKVLGKVVPDKKLGNRVVFTKSQQEGVGKPDCKNCKKCKNDYCLLFDIDLSKGKNIIEICNEFEPKSQPPTDDCMGCHTLPEDNPFHTCGKPKDEGLGSIKESNCHSLPHEPVITTDEGWEKEFDDNFSINEFDDIGKESWKDGRDIKDFIRKVLAEQRYDNEILVNTILETKNKEIQEAIDETAKEWQARCKKAKLLTCDVAVKMTREQVIKEVLDVMREMITNPKVDYTAESYYSELKNKIK